MGRTEGIETTVNKKWEENWQQQRKLDEGRVLFNVGGFSRESSFTTNSWLNSVSEHFSNFSEGCHYINIKLKHMYTFQDYLGNANVVTLDGKLGVL